jgi:4-amino-4-deoxy-L-arabinose transferase-like glycosyltransferase
VSESAAPARPASHVPAEPTRRLPRPGLRERLRRVPRTMWLVTGLWGSLLLAASVVWPVTYGYDEANHIDMVYAYSAKPFTFYAPGGLDVSQATIGLQHILPGHPPKKKLAAVAMPARPDRPTLQQLGGHGATTGPLNQMVQHPPLYYELTALVTHVPGWSGLPWDLAVWLLRLPSILFMLPVPLLCWAAARRLLPAVLPPETPQRTIDSLATMAAVAPMTLPNLIRDGSSVTNDSLLIALTALITYLLCRVLTGDLGRRTAVAVGVSLAAALLTKGFALVLPPVIAAAYLVGYLRSRTTTGRGPRVLFAPVAIAAVGGAVGGLWWLRNLVRFGVVEVNGFGPHANVGPDVGHGQLVRFGPQFLTAFVERIWGGIGYADAPRMSPVLTFGAFAVFGVGALIALVCRGLPGTRRAHWVLAAVPVLSVAVVAAGSYGAYVHHANLPPQASQGRYVYQAIVVSCALGAVGFCAVLERRAQAWITPILLTLALVVNATSWGLILRSWYAASSSAPLLRKTLNGFHALLGFSPLPEVVVALGVLVAPVALGVATLVATVRDARRLSAPVA